MNRVHHHFDAQSVSNGITAADKFSRTPEHLITGGLLNVPLDVVCKECFGQGFIARLHSIRQESRENN